MSKSMRVGELDAGGLAMVAEQGTQSRGGHAGSARTSFQRDEQCGGAGIRAVPGADSDRAVARFPAPAAGSEVCCLCHEREAGLRKATRRRDSKPILRRSGALAEASSPRWPSHARCGNWTRSALLPPPRAARCCVWGPSLAAGSWPPAADRGPWAFAARKLDESRGRSGREHRETHCGGRDRRRRRGH